jgi:hypothetical protein
MIIALSISHWCISWWRPAIDATLQWAQPALPYATISGDYTVRKIRLLSAMAVAAIAFALAGSTPASAASTGVKYPTVTACLAAALQWEAQNPGDSRTAWCDGRVLYIG